ncbi:MAG TPA: aminoglycoside adenylyltransferase domain-containing protein [Noviherbaspirillum sp.]
MTLWQTASDWEGDERNIVLALVRIWYTAVTGDIASKDAAANWALDRLPADCRHIGAAAKDAYLGLQADDPARYPEERAALLHCIRAAVTVSLR